MRRWNKYDHLFVIHDRALNAARKATSVLPEPTSPHKRRSIGLTDSISFLTSGAWLWSGRAFLRTENFFRNLSCQSTSGEKTNLF